MAFLFGRQKTAAEQLREHKRALDKAIRELDRERAALEAQEKKVINDIRKMAKQNQMGAAKIMAKDLVRTRRYIQKFYKMRTQLQGVSLRVQTLKSNAAMADAMKGVTKAMARMNKQLNLPQLQRIMMEFEKQNEQMDMKEEMVSDSIDDAFDEEADDEESEEIINKVMDEIGIDISGQLASTPADKVEAGTTATKNEADKDLQARLDSLRR